MEKPLALRGHSLRTRAGTTIDIARGQDPLDVLLVLARRWKQIGLVSVLFLVIGMLASYFVIKPSYSSVVVMLPPKEVVAAGPMPVGMCISILNGQTIENNIIKDFHLQSIWRFKTLAETRRVLRSEVQIEATGFDGIKITVRDHNSGRAKDLANGFVTELNKFDNDLVVTEAAHRRRLLDQEANSEKSELRHAEDRLKEIQERTALLSPEAQTSQVLQGVSQVHAEINNRNVELQSMRSYASSLNPQVIEATSAISGLKRQLARLEDDSRQRSPGDVQIPAAHLSEILLQYQRALRDVTLHDTQLTLLSSEAAATRIDEVGSASSIRVIDQAVVTDQKSGPQRMFIWLASCWVGLASACLYSFLELAMMNTRHDLADTNILLKTYDVLGLRNRSDLLQ